MGGDGGREGGECISLFDSFHFSESFCIHVPPKGAHSEHFRVCHTLRIV